MSNGNGNSNGQSREVARLLTIPRGRNGEEFRISVDEFMPNDGGEPKRYVSIRVWWRADDGQMRPGKSGCTIRRAELARALDALQKSEELIEGKGAPSNGGAVGSRGAQAETEGPIPF